MVYTARTFRVQQSVSQQRVDVRRRYIDDDGRAMDAPATGCSSLMSA